MALRLQIGLSILLGLTFIYILLQIRKRKLNLQYTLSWLTVLLILLIVLIFPGLLSWFTNIIGVSLPINLIFFLGFLFTLTIVYRLTNAISKQSDQITTLTQKIALMEKEREEHGRKD